MEFIIKVGINGGKSIITVPENQYQGMDLGIDGNVRIIYTNGEKTYPVMEVIEAPDSFVSTYQKLKGLSAN